MELLKVIAMLCQMSISTTYPVETVTFDQEQLECQQYYVKCAQTEEKSNPWHNVLETCINKRKEELNELQN